MRRAAPLVLALAALVAGCGDRPGPPPAPADTRMQRFANAGDAALALDRPEQAVRQYQRALVRARARDDGGAIGEYGTGLAAAYLAANQPLQALDAVRDTRADLARRGQVPPPGLDLAEAIARYRSGDASAADPRAARAEASPDPVTAAQAVFLRGLVADDTGDTAGLENAAARLGRPDNADLQAELAELQARLARRQGDPARAVAEADRAAALYRAALNDRGVARALAVAAEASVQAGNRMEAANLYLRAGQSAAAQGDARSAGAWLRRATDLGAGDTDLQEAARRARASLDRVP